MTVPGPRRRRLRTLAWLALAVLAAGCAPHRVAPAFVLPETRAARFQAALADREKLGRAAVADVTLWLRTAVGGAYPAANGVLALAGPDAARLRVGSAFGTAFDASARGDSLLVVLPARRIGVAADASHDSLGVRGLSALAFHLLAAAWRPPERAWEEAAWSGSLLVLDWEEGGDSLRLAVDGNGLPARVRLRRGDGLEVRARYPRWRAGEGAAWPVEVELEDGEGRIRARCRVERLDFRAQLNPGRMAARAGDRIRLLDWPSFRQALERGEDLR